MDSEKKPNQILDLKSVVIDCEDIRHIEDFFMYYDIKIPEELAKAMETFRREALIESKNDDYRESPKLVKLLNDLRNVLAKVIVESEHPIFLDSAFEEEREIMSSVAFNAYFNEQLEESLKG